MKAELDRIEEMLCDYLYCERLAIDNSNCVGPAYYEKAYSELSELETEINGILSKLREHFESAS